LWEKNVEAEKDSPGNYAGKEEERDDVYSSISFPFIHGRRRSMDLFLSLFFSRSRSRSPCWLELFPQGSIKVPDKILDTPIISVESGTDFYV
jgi:hypothetical protein